MDSFWNHLFLLFIPVFWWFYIHQNVSTNQKSKKKSEIQTNMLFPEEKTATNNESIFTKVFTCVLFWRSSLWNSKLKVKRPAFSVVDHEKPIMLLDIDNVINLSGREYPDHPVWETDILKGAKQDLMLLDGQRK
jgi:hypothetical protein